jgi:hypothetical protein
LINVKVDLPLESYRPGDTVSGKIKAELPDGSPFDNAPSFSLSVNFDSETPDGLVLTEMVSL